MRVRSAHLSALALLALVAAACGDSDPTGPTTSTVAGTYEATSFTASGEDVLAAGGSRP